MDVGLEMFIFMGLILKIPVMAACWLIWHAVRAEPDPVEGEEVTDDGHDAAASAASRGRSARAARAAVRTLPTRCRSPARRGRRPARQQADCRSRRLADRLSPRTRLTGTTSAPLGCPAAAPSSAR